MIPPLLTIVTRTCKRPAGLARTVKSVQSQTRPDYEQIFIVDKVGRHEEGNILWANKQFEKNAHRVDGDYVFPLDDDGVMIDDNFVDSLYWSVCAWHNPEVVLIKTLSPSLPNGGGVRVLPEPSLWNIDWESGERPDRWEGNGYCVVVRSDVWKAHVKNYYSHGEQTGGDWHFCTSLIRGGCQFVRLDVCATRSLSRGRGHKFEPNCPQNWFERTAQKMGFAEVKKDDWRFTP